MPRQPFTLWRSVDNTFPKSVLIAGQETPINSDFRTILKILKIYEDNDVNDVRKFSLILEWFYPVIPVEYANEALTALVEFVAPPKEEYSDPMRSVYMNNQEKLRKEKSQKYCFEFDAEEIYISFLYDYKIDLVEIEYLHWYKFLIMFSNLSKDTPFQRKMELRTMDLKDFKGKDRARMMKAQKAVQIPLKLSTEEMDQMSKLIETLMS